MSRPERGRGAAFSSGLFFQWALWRWNDFPRLSVLALCVSVTACFAALKNWLEDSE